MTLIQNIKTHLIYPSIKFEINPSNSYALQPKHFFLQIMIFASTFVTHDLDLDTEFQTYLIYLSIKFEINPSNSSCSTTNINFSANHEFDLDLDLDVCYGPTYQRTNGRAKGRTNQPTK